MILISNYPPGYNGDDAYSPDWQECMDCDATGIDQDGKLCIECFGKGWIDVCINEKEL